MARSRGDRKREVEGDQRRLDNSKYGKLARHVVAIMRHGTAARMRMILRVVSCVVDVTMCIDLLQV